MRAKDDVSLVAQHLYVHDGDLKTQDAIAADLKSNWAKNEADGAAVAKLLRRHARRGGVRRRTRSSRDELTETEQEAVERSRAETVQNVEERDGSRDLYSGDVLAARRQGRAGRRRS